MKRIDKIMRVNLLEIKEIFLTLKKNVEKLKSNFSKKMFHILQFSE
jgi:hypothetical protein